VFNFTEILSKQHPITFYKKVAHVTLTQKQNMENKFKKELEELDILGYTIIEDVLSPDEIAKVRKKIFEVYELQKKETEPFFDLDSTEESNIARVPFVYDDFFYTLLNNEKIIPIIKAILGEYFTLQAQNGVIVYPNLVHSMSNWHRDLSHMNFVCDPIIAINAFYCITDFNASTGATQLVPHSHKIGYQPSAEFIEKHSISVEAKAGSLFLFNTMMFHQTGRNISDGPRIGLSHMYTKYFIKQQMDIPALLNFVEPEDPFLRTLLGFGSHVPTNVLNYRKHRFEVTKNRKKK
jgi:ectoine hydroxylase-related dioxygenase (phytanoyl-CoA dioxygenase family)